MTLRAQMAADVLGMMNLNEFGEEITYFEPGREPKSIVGLVTRSKEDVALLRSRGETASASGYGRFVFALTIANDDALGMTSIRPGQDKVELLKQWDDPEPTAFAVTQILQQDQGGWTLELMA